MAELIEDPKKKKASFGDAAAAATDGGVTQMRVGKPGDFPVNPDGTPMQKQAPAMEPGLGALAPAAPPSPQSDYARQMGEVGKFFGAIPGKVLSMAVSAPGSGGPLDFSSPSKPTAAAATPPNPALTGARMNASTDPRSLANPAYVAPAPAIAASDAALPPAAPAPSVAAGAIAPPAQTDGQRVMDMNNRMADQMRAERMALESAVPQAQVLNSTNDWAARKNLDNLATGASSIMNKTGGRGGVSPAVTAYQAALAHDISLQGGATPADINNTNVAQQNASMKVAQGNEAAKLAQSNSQFGANQAIAKQRLALDGRKADLADAGSRMDNETKAQLQGLNAQILKETDPAKLSVLQDKAQTITGKYQRPDAATRMTVVPQGSYIDEKTQQVLQKPSLVLGPDGQVMGQQTQQAAATVKSQSDFDKLKKGDTYTGEDGKTYRK